MRVTVSKRGRKDIDILPLHIKNQVTKVILSFEADPGSVDLKKMETKKDLYRIRAGNMRITVKVNWKKGVAFVERVVNRKDFDKI
jgi:mRNA-degrading endonuclease RelE of RelBE toxin-antitoxin system